VEELEREAGPFAPQVYEAPATTVFQLIALGAPGGHAPCLQVGRKLVMMMMMMMGRQDDSFIFPFRKQFPRRDLFLYGTLAAGTCSKDL
jgi:hypothetical protein